MLGLVFYHWDEAKDIEARKQPLNLKSAALVKMLKCKWKPCGKRLTAGQYVRKVCRSRYDFDGRSLLELVAKYRANPKGHGKFLSHVQFKARQYFDSVPEEFRPDNRDDPIHLYWSKARTAFRPQKTRKQLFRKTKETSTAPTAKTVEVTEVKLTLDQKLNAAVDAMKK